MCFSQLTKSLLFMPEYSKSQSERSDDMFCDDIFGDSPAGVRKTVSLML